MRANIRKFLTYAIDGRRKNFLGKHHQTLAYVRYLLYLCSIKINLKLTTMEKRKAIPAWQLRLGKVLVALSGTFSGMMRNDNFITFEYDGAKYKVMADGVRKNGKLVHRGNCEDYFINLV